MRDHSSLVALSLSLTGRAAFRHIEDESQPSGVCVCMCVCGFPHFVGYIINRADSETSTATVTQIRETTVFPPPVKRKKCLDCSLTGRPLLPETSLPLFKTVLFYLLFAADEIAPSLVANVFHHCGVKTVIF